MFLNARQRVQALKAQRLKAKLCKLKRDILEPSGGGGGKVAGFEAPCQDPEKKAADEGQLRAGAHCQVQRIGDARVGLVGFPSVGKSSLLTALTGVQPGADSIP